jgi:hypothetical protein
MNAAVYLSFHYRRGDIHDILSAFILDVMLQGGIYWELSSPFYRRD